MEIDKIYLGDCLELMKEIPDKSIDCIICDLPYGTTACAWDSIIPFDKLWAEYKRIRKPNAPILLFGSEPFSTMIRMSNLSEFRYDWIWEKSQGANFVHAKIKPLKIHETISVFYGDIKTIYNPQGLRPCHKVKSNSAKFGTNIRDWNHADEYVQEWENYPTSILRYSNPAGRERFHPTQKPVELIRYLVRTYTNEGDLVLDNCIGSGTTAVACIKEKRHFIGMELNKEYYDIACKRVKNELSNPTLF